MQETPQEEDSVSSDHVDRRAWLALSVATLAALLTVIDVSIVNVAFPSIKKDLGAKNIIDRNGFVESKNPEDQFL